ncbi:MAG: YihY/virulence factor BrkB family protein [Armatimonadota bacterium]
MMSSDKWRARWTRWASFGHRVDWQERWSWLKSFLAEVWCRITEDRLPLSAAAIAFYILVSIFPLLLLIISIGSLILGGEPNDITRVQEIVESLSNQLLSETIAPEVRDALVKEILKVVNVSTTFTGLSILLGLLTGTQVFLILESAMNQVWRAERARPFWLSRLLGLLMMVITGLVLLIAIGLINTIHFLGDLYIPLWNRELSQIPVLRTVFPFLVAYFVPFLLTTMIFGVIYRILPLKRVTWHSALPGALFAAFVWVIFVRLFGLYVSRFANYSIVYGSLAGIILLLFLFYYGSLIMLVGAEIASVYHKRLMQAGDKEEQIADTAMK